MVTSNQNLHETRHLTATEKPPGAPNVTAYRTIASEYAPYNLMSAFHQGTRDYLAGRELCPHHELSDDNVAWHFGRTAMKRFAKQFGGRLLTQKQRARALVP
jgi:hypothetical protein